MNTSGRRRQAVNATPFDQEPQPPQIEEDKETMESDEIKILKMNLPDHKQRIECCV